MKKDYEKYASIYASAPILSSINSLDDYWSRACRQYSIDTLKYISLDNIAGLLQEDDILFKFVSRMNKVAMYPISFFGIVMGYGFRALESKQFCHLLQRGCNIYTCNNAYKNASDYKFATPLIFTEGVLDAEFFGLIYPYSFAYLGSGISSKLAQLLSCFTNRVVICSDRDAAGDRGYNKSYEVLSKYGISVGRIFLPHGIEDPGDFLKKLMDGVDCSSDIDVFINNQLCRFVRLKGT